MHEMNESLSRVFSVVSFTKEQPGIPGRENEDVIFVAENQAKIVAAVIDGGTQMSALTSATNTLGGRFAALNVAEGIREGFSTAKNAKMLLLEANVYLSEKSKEKGLEPNETDSEALPTACGSLCYVDMAKGLISIAQLGDTVALAVFDNGIVKRLIHPKTCIEDSKAYELACYIAVKKHIPLKEAIKNEKVAEILLLGRYKENFGDGYGYGSLNGKENAKLYIQQLYVPHEHLSKIILMTDGMLPPGKTFHSEPDWRNVANDLLKLGPEKFYKQKVYKLKSTDESLIKYPRLKIHDDASCIILTVL